MLVILLGVGKRGEGTLVGRKRDITSDTFAVDGMAGVPVGRPLVPARPFWPMGESIAMGVDAILATAAHFREH